MSARIDENGVKTEKLWLKQGSKDLFAKLQAVLEMAVGVLIQLATKWASLHHVYEAGFQLKVHVPNINVGSSCHIGS